MSYRRDDTQAYTGRLHDSLVRHINPKRLFMDLDKIRGGINFMDAINSAIDSAQVMIVVIGPKWLSIAYENSPPRILDPNDFVHQEVALGLKRSIHVLPVLVGGAKMPDRAELPDGLKRLADFQAREITDSRWKHDVSQLIEDLETISDSDLNRV